ncbi:MAG: Serine/threonine protein kinase PrkC, regulator of stationary phase [Myxococcaceae bacterium]|nr:Serine/threonine protein kinase PrkC, regulator of stationary phase [Myxococcaceae bacterium]
MAEPVSTTTGTTNAPGDPLIGRVINDRFKVLSVIARGGMGKVYKAEQAPLGRIVALKVLQPNYNGENDPEFHKRFFLEASIVSKLTHPNTVTLYDYGQSHDNVYFMAMEYLEGRTLHRLLREEAPLEVGRALHILVQTCRALREAHGHGVIHRDLKPANIYLVEHDDDHDFVKVLDFGLLKRTDETAEEALTQTGLFMGSPKYMAPEQIRGERVSPATDVYSLGVMLFELLTGKVPFERSSSVNLLMAHVSDPVPTLVEVNPLVQVPAAVEEIVYRCLAKRPEERYASMDELIAAIKQAGASFGRPLGSMSGEFMNSLGGRVPTSGESPVAPIPSSLPPPLPRATTPPESLAPAVPTSVTASTPAPAPHRSPLLLGAGLFVLAVGLGVAIRLVAAPARPTPAAAAPSVQVAFDSDPAGAEVLENGVSLGRTPLRNTWTGARGNPDTAHTVVFRREGFEDEQVTLSGAQLTHVARLRPRVTEVPPMPTARVEPPPPVEPAPAAPRPGRRPNRVPPRANPDPNAQTPTGYRDNVY